MVLCNLKHIVMHATMFRLCSDYVQHIENYELDHKITIRKTI